MYIKTKYKLAVIFVIVFICSFPFFPIHVQAQQNLTLTITPPLVMINMNPGESWSSSVKVVNNNNDEITIYAQTLDFKSGEGGGVDFIETDEIDSLADEDKNFLLSQWLDIGEGPYNIAAQSSIEVPFTIKLPEDAGPGGHYAAILVGTKPDEELAGTYLKISQLLASLILVTVKGDIIERGNIREFSTNKRFYEEPDVNFTLRFQNSGNVHLQPQGEIAIYDMFNKERGRITINHTSEFGRVLPRSIRMWDFNWQGEDGILNMGRYKAMLILAYGDQARETIDQTLYFWVVNYKLVAVIIGSLLLFLLITIILIRAYIKRAVKLSQQTAGIVLPSNSGQKPGISVIPKIDRNSDEQTEDIQKKMNNKTGDRRLKRFSLTRLLIIIIIIFTCGAGVYIFLVKEKSIDQATEIKQNQDNGILEVTIDEANDKISEVVVVDETTTTTTISNDATNTIEQIENDNRRTGATTGEDTIENESEVENNENIDITIKILNGSGVSGLAGKAAELFKTEGYFDISTGNADAFNYSKTIIKYKLGKLNEAEAISEILNISVEYEEVSEQKEDIILILGKDLKI